MRDCRLDGGSSLVFQLESLLNKWNSNAPPDALNGR